MKMIACDRRFDWLVQHMSSCGIILVIITKIETRYNTKPNLYLSNLVVSLHRDRQEILLYALVLR